MAAFSSLGLGLLIGGLAGAGAQVAKKVAGAGGDPVQTAKEGGGLTGIRKRIAARRDAAKAPATAAQEVAATAPPNATAASSNAVLEASKVATQRKRKASAAGARPSSTATGAQLGISASYAGKSLIGG